MSQRRRHRGQDNHSPSCIQLEIQQRGLLHYGGVFSTNQPSEQGRSNGAHKHKIARAHAREQPAMQGGELMKRERMTWRILSWISPLYDMQSFIVWNMAGMAHGELAVKEMRRWREPRAIVEDLAFFS